VKVNNGYGCTDSASVTVNFSFDVCTGVDEIFPNGTIRIHPNPGNGNLHLELQAPGQAVKISILSMLGTAVITDHIFHAPASILVRDYDFSDLPAGIYLVRVTCNEVIYNVKFINR
jgi:hypothetical protein